MNKNRTLVNLRNNVKGKIYIWLANEKIGQEFLKNAEAEGFMFGKIKPTDNTWSDIIALEYRKQLSYANFIGHICFQCNGGDSHLLRVDYEKYIHGDTDFIFKDKTTIQETVVKGKFFGDITILGDESFDAANLLREGLTKCESEDDESRLYDEVEKVFDVIILPEWEY